MKTHNSIRSMSDAYESDMIKHRRGCFIILSVIIIMILCFFMACGDDGDTVVVADPPVIIDPPPDPEPENEPIQLSLWTGAELKFYDGESIFSWETGITARAESGVYSHENILYYLDEYGQDISSQNLITTPDLIAVSPTDYYIYEHIDPVTASGMGGLYKDYSRFYQGNTEIGSWPTQQYITDKICIIDSELFARQTSGKWNAITGTKTDIHYVMSDFIIYDYDGTTRTAKIKGVSVSWSTNFLNGVKYWQESGGKYYSERGYIWDGVTLDESTGIMTDWRIQPFITGYTEAPVIISAGTHAENSETVIYWIECNSGWVVRQVTSTNQMTLHIRLYAGDGIRTTGVFYSDLLKPVIVGDYLYFIFEANVYRYSFVDGLTAHFTGGVSEVWVY